METLKTIKPGTTLTARSIGDHNCIFSVKVLSRTDKTATVEYHGEKKRCKIHVWDNCETIYALGQYSMAPSFKAV
jgi:hypothetical protein